MDRRTHVRGNLRLGNYVVASLQLGGQRKARSSAYAHVAYMKASYFGNYSVMPGAS